MDKVTTELDMVFQNIGSKIKTLAKIVLVGGVFISILLAVIQLATADDAYFEDAAKELGFVLLIGGPIASYISSILIYGFGQLVENTSKRAENGCSTASVENSKLS